MLVFWATNNETTLPTYAGVVQYGTSPSSLSNSALAGPNTNYTAFGILSPSLRHATITNLIPSTFYYYRVGDASTSSGTFSEVYNFTAAPVTGKSSYPISFLTYGDMGVLHSQNTANLTAALLSAGQASFIVHSGDISYADDRASINKGTIYDAFITQFYNEVQPSSSIAPMMISPGNHEAILSFLAYRTRVSPTMPSNGSPFWYSYNLGPIHFLAFDQDQDWKVNSDQYNFIVSDLTNVDRSLTPWVIAYNHFPLRTSNNFWGPDAGPFAAVYEPLFNAEATHVDLHLSGHVHAAEVLFPNIGGVPTQTNFSNMKQTLHVMTGFPGDIEVCCNSWVTPKPAYSYWRDDDVASDGGFFGFTQITVQNETHLNVKVWNAGNQSVVLDLWTSRFVPT
jgi:hypothetical protein